MAKKRTLVPFYGKDNQALETAAKAAFKAGDINGALALTDQCTKVYKKRKAARRV